MRENLCCMDPMQAMREPLWLAVPGPAGRNRGPSRNGLRRLRRVWKLWMERRRTRRELERLAGDAHLLRDVGARREDLLRQARRPFWRA